MSIFVSHVSRDSGLPLYDVLLRDLRRQTGHEVWVDSQLAGGQVWWDEICKQIRECSVFLVVVTPRLIKSEACLREVSYAAELCKPLLPVKIADVVDWQLPLLVAQTQVLDFTKRRDPGDAGVECALGLNEAVRRLGAAAGPLPDPLPDQPGVPSTYLSDLQRFLQAPELTLADQERFLFSVRTHLDDDDREPQELAAAISAFLNRPDVVYRVHAELNRCLSQLAAAPHVVVTEASAAPPAVDPEPAGPPADRESAPSSAARLKLVSLPAQPTASSPPAQRRSGVAEPVVEDSAPTSDSLEDATATTGRANRFPAPELDVQRLADSLKTWFESQRLEAAIHEDGDAVVVQSRSSSLARKVGAGVALSVVLRLDSDELEVTLGGAKWGDKVAAVGVGALVAWPALITAAVGGYKQATLPQRTLTYIESTIPRCRR